MNISGQRNRLQGLGDRGQVTIFVVIAMSLFLIGFVGFAVDMTNLWFHRQMAQGAADAACQAGIMDVLLTAQGGTPPSPGFTPGTAFNCAGAPSSVPCRYAVFNGYNGTGLIANTPSNAVSVSFPGSVLGVITPPASQAPVPFLRVDIEDRVGLTFASMIPPFRRSSDVRAFAECGLVFKQIPIPLIVLDPLRACTFDVRGTGMQPKLSILGGPDQSVQINSNCGSSANPSCLGTGSTAACASGGPIISLANGGPNFTGSEFGNYGLPTSPAPGPPFTFLPGSTGKYTSPHPPIQDPYWQTPAPARPGPPALGVNGTAVGDDKKGQPVGQNGCPVPAGGGGCTEYSGGYYPSGIDVKKGTAIFDPGLYYLGRGLHLLAQSDVRPSTAVGDGNGGTTFYFAGSESVQVWANSGSNASLTPFQTSRVQCPGGLLPDPGINLPLTLGGVDGANVLMGPCFGPYGQLDVVVDPATGNIISTTPARGMLFFQNRATNGAGAWGGGGSFLLAGTMYFHQCNPSGTGVGCLNPPAAYNASFDFQGNACSSTYVLGNIITDQLYLHGTPCIKMALDPYMLFSVLKASLLR